MEHVPVVMVRKLSTRPGRVVVTIVFGLLVAVSPVTVFLADEVATAASCVLPTFGPGGRYDPVVDPPAFTPNVDNPWFPLKVGTTLVYSGIKERKKAVDLLATTARTRMIAGVETRVVEDRLLLDGRLEERTSDYYAQD